MGWKASQGETILSAVGRTPLVQLSRLPKAGGGQVWAKLEMFNPTGSYKDRMALGMIEGAEARGELRPGMTVVERTGGSTGASLALACAVKGYRFKVVSSDVFAQAKLATMRAFGAEVTVVHGPEGGLTPELMEDMRLEVERIVAEDGAYFTDQFNNADAVRGYEPAGDEIIDQLGRPPDAFCAAVGSAGFLMGVGRALKQASPDVRLVALEPAASPVLSGGAPGAHGIEGVGVGYVPPHYEPEIVDSVMALEEEEAVETALAMARQEGIFAGISSGLNVAAACRLAVEMGPDQVIVTTAVDSGLKYLDGDVFDAR